VVLTHAYGETKGIHYIDNNLKVIYLPYGVFYNQVVLPTIYTTLPLLRKVFIKEGITIVHGHSAFSTLCQDAMLHAKSMGLKTVFTDHSLFGFADASSIITNKFLEFSLTEVDHVICVSNTSKENTVLRASLVPQIVSVIPNAVDLDMFTPDVSKRNKNHITIVVVSRLVYRKGMDLLAGLIPEICSTYPKVNFLIAGEGPKRVLLEEVREQHHLLNRVKFLGRLNHDEVRDILVQGDIFVNTSLTEAFCMAIVEAASCGLRVVSTSVGGIPEVLPPDMLYLAEPSVGDLIRVLKAAINEVEAGEVLDVDRAHDRIKSMYNWNDVAKRTEAVYNGVVSNRERTFMERMDRFCRRAPVAGKIYMLLAALDMVLLKICDWFLPLDSSSRDEG